MTRPSAAAPRHGPHRREHEAVNSRELQDIIEHFKVRQCIDCGKCTGACPLAQVDKRLSPRLAAQEVLAHGLNSQYLQDVVWGCITCGLCLERCPNGIDFPGFVRALRPLLRELELPGHLSHGGSLHALMRMQAAPDLKQNRTGWISSGLKTSQRGEVLFFSGCSSYLQAYFDYLDIDLGGIPRAALRLLNHLGVEPVVLDQERCCGHDLYYSGDVKSFEALRGLNIAQIADSGARTIVTACAECAHTLADLYPQDADWPGAEVLHLSEYLTREGFQVSRPGPHKAAYQDPCRLGRLRRVFDPPRQLLSQSAELVEMAHFGPGAWCCGNSAFLGCDRYAKRLQTIRLAEARATGADCLVTACPKCQIHLSCAARDLESEGSPQPKVRDLSQVLAESL